MSSSFPRKENSKHSVNKFVVTNDISTERIYPRQVMQRSIRGSLPCDIRVSNGKLELIPALLFAPPHIQSAEPDLSKIAYKLDQGRPKNDFLKLADNMLANENPGQFPLNPGSSNTSYDFDEYVLLRNPDDPYTGNSNNSELFPNDPKFQRYLNEVNIIFTEFINHVSKATPNTTQALKAQTLHDQLFDLWFKICSLRAYNRLIRYSPSKLNSPPERVYGERLKDLLIETAASEVQSYLEANKENITILGDIITSDYWEEILNEVFDESIKDDKGNELNLFRSTEIIDPTAPADDYPFDSFPSYEVLFGLRIVNRQTWQQLGYGRGELVKSIPLSPRESQKISVKVLRRRKTTRTFDQTSSSETTSETTNNTKDSSEIVNEATQKLNRHIEAEVSGGYFSFFNAKVSGGIAEDTGSSSKQTKNRLNEVMEKTASRMKRDTKVTISTETEESYEETRSSELSNPNDEIAVTYLYYQLQLRYWVSTEISEVNSVVFIPEPLPAWNAITEDWVREHGDIITDALLDSSFSPLLTAIRREPSNLSYENTDIFINSANAGIAVTDIYKNHDVAMPDLLASGQQYYERDYERRNNLRMENERRTYQKDAFITHIRRNILHYMRAIWSSEDFDQKMQRYSRMRVTTSWIFLPEKTLPGGIDPTRSVEIQGRFIPDASSARPLTDVINPIGPIGYLFNCAIYQLRDDTKLINLHTALNQLRASYIRFAMNVTIFKGENVYFRQAVAYAPRNFIAEYTLMYKNNKWLLEIPNQPEEDWIPIERLPDESLDIKTAGLRIWLDGNPDDITKVIIKLRSTGQLEDPHLRLVEMSNPLPRIDLEAEVFTDSLIRQMSQVLPEISQFDDFNGEVIDWGKVIIWDDLKPGTKNFFRERYHRFLMLQQSGRLVTLDTDNVVLDLTTSRSPALEPFKKLHRYVDVMKAYREQQGLELDIQRRQELLDKGILGDPNIEHITLVSSNEDIKKMVAVDGEPHS